MLIKSQLALVPIVALTFALSGCAKPPEQEITGARAELQAAEEAAAETWASTEWTAAQTAMNAVEEELATQDGKMGISRSYEHTLELLADAKAKAESAQAAAVANQEAARKEAQSAVDAETSSLAAAQAAAQALTECPRKPKGFDADMAIVAGNLEALQGEQSALSTYLEAENYSSATQEANDLSAEIAVVLADLQAVQEKIGCVPAATEE